METKNCTTCFFGSFEEYADTPCSTCSVMGNGNQSMWLDEDLYKEDKPKQGTVSITMCFDTKDFFAVKKLLSNINISVDYHDSTHI